MRRVQDELILQVNEAVLVGVYHLEQILELLLSHLKPRDLLQGIFELWSLNFLVEDVVFKIIDVSEEVLQ